MATRFATPRLEAAASSEARSRGLEAQADVVMSEVIIDE